MARVKVVLEVPDNTIQFCRAEAFLEDKEEFRGRKKVCSKTDIVLSVMEDGEKYPICSRCWERICESNVEWTYLGGK